MDFETIIILGIIFGSAVTIVKTIFTFAKWKIEHDDKTSEVGTGNSLGQAELEIMIENAVSRATQDIFHEVKDLREDLELMGTPEKPQLSLNDLPDLEKRESSKRTRSRRRE